MRGISPSAAKSEQPGSSPSSSDTALRNDTNGTSTGRSGKEESRRKQANTQPRLVLSCTQCRTRKVKCDRTKPCSACCARGNPRECFFVVTEGSDYKPIQQSYEIRKLRAENMRLKERLRAKDERPNESDSNTESPDQEPGTSTVPNGRSKRTAPVGLKQKMFKGNDPADSIYFGSPGMANIIHEFEKLQVGNRPSKSLAHIMPRGVEIYNTAGVPTYPFPTLWAAFSPICIPELVLQCLPSDKEIFEYLAAFQKRAQICAFPHVPDEITEKEVERFLKDRVQNAEKSPDMLALVFAALALGAHNGSFDKFGGKWKVGGVKEECLKGDVWLAASMQALRIGSFMNRPTILGLEAVIMMCPYLTNTGRFLDAWTLFGTAIRLAHSIGLHRNPKYLDPAPPLRECTIRQALWWWMLHVDQQYSTTLGRPLGISGIGDCPPPEQLTTNTTIVRLGEYINKFTVLARQILSSDRLSNSKIDDFTDRLNSLWETMPEVLRFHDGWLKDSYELPEWPLDAIGAVFHGKTHNFIILLNRQRLENAPSRNIHAPYNPNGNSQNPLPPVMPSSYSYDDNNVHFTNSVDTAASDNNNRSNLRGRPLVISSSMSLLSAFIFYKRRIPAALMCWTMGQLAFNASMILILDALETRCTENIWKVWDAFAVFSELEEKGIHKLASLAKGWIGWGLESLRRMDEEEEGKKGDGERNQQQYHLQGQQQAQYESEDGNRPEAPSCHTSHLHQMFAMEDKLPTLTPPMDTVMGNTGMFLLEDSGLQSFKPEAFAPLAWNMAGSELSNGGSTVNNTNANGHNNHDNGNGNGNTAPPSKKKQDSPRTHQNQTFSQDYPQPQPQSHTQQSNLFHTPHQQNHDHQHQNSFPDSTPPPPLFAENMQQYQIQGIVDHLSQKEQEEQGYHTYSEPMSMESTSSAIVAGHSGHLGWAACGFGPAPGMV